MNKITTNQIIDTIKRNIRLIIAPAVIIALLVFSFMTLRGNGYEANAVLMVTSNNDEPVSYNKLILNEKLANIYAQFLESESLYDKVAERLDDNQKGEDISDKLKFEVNPQGGVITFTYNDKNEDRSHDTLLMITEEFRKYAKDYLNMDNIEYLQDVTVKKSSILKSIIFSIVGLILGALIGILFMILKEILTNRIENSEDIRSLGIEVLGNVSHDKDNEYLKIKAKIAHISQNAVIGITSLSSSKDTIKVSYDLTNALALTYDTILIEPFENINETIKSDEDIEDVKKEELEILNLNIKQVMKSNIDSKEFEDKIYSLKEKYNYVIINEPEIGSAIAYLTTKYEDMKIIVVDKKTQKDELLYAKDEIEKLGTKVIGVIYHK